MKVYILKLFFVLVAFFMLPNFAEAAFTFSHGWPTGTLSSSTTSVVISFETSEDVQYCKYSNSPNVPFDSMTQQIGGWGAHFFFQKFENLSSGIVYHYYIKCADAAWQPNAVDYEILFAIAIAPNPEVSSVQGSLTHGQLVTINGSGFGVKSPVAPLMYDLADDEIAYDELSNGDLLPFGQQGDPWNYSNAYYKTTNPRGKNMAHYSNQWTTTPERRAIVGGNNFLESTGKPLYLSYWIHTDADFNPVVDGQGNRNQSNKFMRLTNDASWFQQDINSGFVWSPHSSSLTVGNGWYVTPNIIYAPMVIYTGWNEIGQIDQWNRNEVIVDNSTSPTKPRITEYINSKLLIDYKIADMGELAYPDVTGIGSLGFDSSNDQGAGAPMVDWGEIYIDNTRAKVEICDTNSWATRTHCEIQIPEMTWNDGQIKIRVNQGSFADGANGYVYVVDSIGNVNETGMFVTFNSGVSDLLAPSAPSGLSAL